MELAELSPNYLTALARQIGFLAAFLGGVSATFCATMLTRSKPSKAAHWSMSLSGMAALSFIAAASLSTTLIAHNHPDAPAMLVENSTHFERLGMGFGFAFGVYVLLAAIAVGGWSRTRSLGTVLTAMALFVAVLITMSIF